MITANTIEAALELSTEIADFVCVLNDAAEIIFVACSGVDAGGVQSY